MKAELIGFMGDDLRVVNAARVSFDKESDWEYTNEGYSIDRKYYGGHPKDRKDLSEKDQKLINYLAKHNHWTPFSHVMVTMRETVPIFVARQRFKHMVGFTYNEVSRRYVDDIPEFFEPKWRWVAPNKKQGSLGEIDDYNLTGYANEVYLGAIRQCEGAYDALLEIGIAPEQARMVLPQSMYTSYYVTGSLSAWARAYKLRSDPHAQKEIQELAALWAGIIGNIPEMKYSWNALVS